jgi:uncharacterized membrane protein
MRPSRSIPEGLALTALAAQFLYLAAIWKSLPAQIATHFNGSGTPDGYGPKSTALLIPVVALFLYALLTLVSYFPDTFNYPVAVTDATRTRLAAISVRMLGWIKAELCCTLGYICWQSARVALGQASGLGWAFLPVMLATLAITIGAGIVEMRRAA